MSRSHASGVAVVTRGYGGDVDEARLEDTEYGRAPATEGWFVVNVRDAAWMRNSKFGAACIIESADVQFPQIGYTIAVLGRGGRAASITARTTRRTSSSSRASASRSSRARSGGCGRGTSSIARPGTEHIFVGAGDEPCVIFMAGARAHRGSAVYPRNEVALRHGAGVEVETARSRDAYAPFPAHEPGPPANFAGLPFG